MELILTNLPKYTRDCDITELIERHCSLKCIIGDIVVEGKTKRITVSVADDEKANLLYTKLNGMSVGGLPLHIEQKKTYPVYGTESQQAGASQTQHDDSKSTSSSKRPHDNNEMSQTPAKMSRASAPDNSHNESFPKDESLNSHESPSINVKTENEIFVKTESTPIDQPHDIKIKNIEFKKPDAVVTKGQEDIIKKDRAIRAQVTANLALELLKSRGIIIKNEKDVAFRKLKTILRSRLDAILSNKYGMKQLDMMNLYKEQIATYSNDQLFEVFMKTSKEENFQRLPSEQKQQVLGPPTTKTVLNKKCNKLSTLNSCPDYGTTSQQVITPSPVDFKRSLNAKLKNLSAKKGSALLRRIENDDNSRWMVTSNLAFELLKSRGYSMGDRKKRLKDYTKMKNIIRSRLDGILGNEKGMEQSKMLNRYKNSFPLHSDEQLFNVFLGNEMSVVKHRPAVQKQQVKKEFLGDESLYNLPPTTETIFNEELKKLSTIFTSQLDKKMAVITKEKCLRTFDNIMRLKLVERLLDIKTNLSIRICARGMKTSLEQCANFLHNYGVVGLKNSGRSEDFFIADCDSHASCDKLLTMNELVMYNGQTILSAHPLPVIIPPNFLNWKHQKQLKNNNAAENDIITGNVRDLNAAKQTVQSIVNATVISGASEITKNSTEFDKNITRNNISDKNVPDKNVSDKNIPEDYTIDEYIENFE